MSTSTVLINPLGHRRRDLDGHGVCADSIRDVARLMAGVHTIRPRGSRLRVVGS